MHTASSSSLSLSLPLSLSLSLSCLRSLAETGTQDSMTTTNPCKTPSRIFFSGSCPGLEDQAGFVACRVALLLAAQAASQQLLNLINQSQYLIHLMLSSLLRFYIVRTYIHTLYIYIYIYIYICVYSLPPSENRFSNSAKSLLCLH